MSDTNATKRKWAPKSKSGCSTCKSRRVKCDEKQPRCTPCRKSSRQCEYTPDRDPDPLKVVLWRPNNVAIQHISPTPNHSNEESRAFHFFRTKVATNLGGLFDSSFWTLDVLRVAQHEDPVRHAIVALASLSETILDTAPGSSKPPPKPFAIRQHSKAISNLRKKIDESDDSSVEVIPSPSHNEEALSHMSSGIYVYFNWHSNRRKSLPRNTPTAIEVQLQRLFGRLTLQTILFVQARPQEWKFVIPSFTPELPSIPLAFGSLEEARASLDGCMCSLYHGMLASQFQGLDNNLQEIAKAPTSQHDPLEEWALAYKRFMENQIGRLSPSERNAATLLEIQQITGSIIAATMPVSQETVFDSFDQSFAQVITLATQLLCSNDEQHADPEPPLFPAFEMGIIPHLYFAASRCRDPSLRRQALYLLRLGPRQEGIWHRDVLAGIAERIISMEEVGCQNAQSSADIPGSARLSMLNTTIDSARCTVTLHCCRQQSEEGIGYVMYELVEY
ncbi:Sterol uptake control protein 2 [Lachnellula arida]|uniref:Sterol uptake control protein 2 n=1 Tax=Lachnellula arida TaxID=1316785 RepID=A0A8T9BCB0_9HELO|nr:Sterol uptake control protein 2 [Lachnellula arida]